MDLDQIDFERRGPMLVGHNRIVITLPAATELPWRQVVTVADDLMLFGALVWPNDVRISVRKLELVQRAWMAHNGLPEVPQMRRLTSMVQRYHDGIEFDFRTHFRLSFGDLFRERRWREILNYLDQLPANSQMNRLLSLDEEYMESVLRSQKGDQGPSRPSMADWSLTNSLLATLIDAVNKNTATQTAIANPKGAKPRIEPTPRPLSLVEKIERRIQKERHEEMVGRLLPGKVS